MLQSLLNLDTSLLISARTLVGPEYARLIQISGESVVIWGALMLIGLWLFGVSKKDNAPKIWALQIFFTVILTFFFYTIINFGFDKWRPSPQEIAGAIAPLIPHPLDNSFPSGHALFTAGLLAGLIRFSPKKGLIAGTLIFGLITAFSRVVGGVHYPGDIIGGWVLGGIGAYIGSILIDHAFFRNFLFAPLIKIASFFRL